MADGLVHCVEKGEWYPTVINCEHLYRLNIGAHGVTAIVIGNGHGDTSSNPRRDWLHFT